MTEPSELRSLRIPPFEEEQANLADIILSGPKGSGHVAIIDLRDPAAPESYNYGELESLVDQTAVSLLSHGFPVGSRIGILSANRFEFIVAYLGILRAGFVAVPLNFALPKDVLETIIVDANIVTIFVDEPRVELLPRWQDAIFFDGGDHRNFWSVVNSGPVRIDAESKNLNIACILYTSGTSGTPKGVPLDHSGQAWALEALSSTMPQGERMIIAQPLFHMNGLILASLVLKTRGTIVLTPTFQVSSYLNAVITHKITSLLVVPAMWARMLTELERNRSITVPTLKAVKLASAPTSLQLIERTRRLFPELELTQIYGTTEAGPAVFGPHPSGLPTPVMAVGYPLPGSEVKLVDGDGQESGVLAMKNPAVTAGYDQLKAKSREVLRGGWYVSGDVMRRDSDGFYYFLGRMDDMINCAGHNIFPEEVERTLERHPAVRQAAVVPLLDEERGQVPVAFVTLIPGEKLTAAQLVHLALEQAPPYQHPRRIAFVDELPIGGTKKVDIAALKSLAQELENRGGWS